MIVLKGINVYKQCPTRSELISVFSQIFVMVAGKSGYECPEQTIDGTEPKH